MTVVRDMVTTGIAVTVHDGASLAGACLTEYVAYHEVTPRIGELSVPEGGTGTLLRGLP